MSYTVKQLFDVSIPEGESVEYKRELNLNDAKGKKKLASSITAFANAKGGQLFIGIAEDKDSSRPVEIVDHGIQNIDEFGQRASSIISHYVTPQFSSFSIDTDTSYGGEVIVITIAEGFQQPYAVKTDHHYQFYKRVHNTKQPLEYGEIKNMILSTNLFRQRLDAFINDRLTNPYVFTPNDDPDTRCPFTLLHIIPRRSLDNDQLINIQEVKELVEFDFHAKKSSSIKWDIDGIYVDGLNSHLNRTKLMSNGIFEITHRRNPERCRIGYDKIPLVFSEEIEKGLKELLKFISENKVFDLNYYPFFISVKLLQVRGTQISLKNPGRVIWSNDPIEYDEIYLPIIEVPSPEAINDELIQPLMLKLCNAYGYSRDVTID